MVGVRHLAFDAFVAKRKSLARTYASITGRYFRLSHVQNRPSQLSPIDVFSLVLWVCQLSRNVEKVLLGFVADRRFLRGTRFFVAIVVYYLLLLVAITS